MKADGWLEVKLHAFLTSVVSLFHVPATILPIEFEAVWTLEPN